MKTFELTHTELHGMDDPTLVYHIVDNVPYHDHARMRKWCRKIFGEQQDLRFSGIWQSPHCSMIYFRNEEDRTLFLLRWA